VAKTDKIILSLASVLFTVIATLAPFNTGLLLAQSSAITEPFQAIVSDSEAVFTFPIKAQKWKWEGWGGVGVDYIEYSWMVNITNDGHDYQLGFNISRSDGPLHNQAMWGFQELLDHGHFYLGKVSKDRSGESCKFITDANITGITNNKNDILTIRVQGNRFIQLLFSSKPKNCVFKSQIKNKITLSKTVNIIYTK
jgi:hypothetical protein